MRFIAFNIIALRLEKKNRKGTRTQQNFLLFSDFNCFQLKTWLLFLVIMSDAFFFSVNVCLERVQCLITIIIHRCCTMPTTSWQLPKSTHANYLLAHCHADSCQLPLGIDANCLTRDASMSQSPCNCQSRSAGSRARSVCRPCRGRQSAMICST